MTYTEILISALESSHRGKSKLTKPVLDVGGFSGKKFKHLLNNLGAECRCYLEIGSLHGASLTATCFGNLIAAYAVENFSEFDGKHSVLKANIDIFAPQTMLLVKDAFDPETAKAIPDGSVDLFFYDGNHSEDSHEKALAAFDGCLSNELIYICDDWNWKHVKAAALRGLASAPFEVVHSREIATKDGDGEGYWNGLGLFVLKRKTV